MNAHVHSELAEPVTRHDHVRGPHRAPVTLVEYGDIECPYCGQAHSILRALEQEMEGQLRFVFRHFPLTTIHPFAEHASEAAEAAGAQGKFWEMHDLLFENQDALSDEDLVTYSAELNLDARRVANDIVTGAHAARIGHDIDTGLRSEVDGTPMFFINGKKYNGDLELYAMLEALQAEL
ncbi:MAG: oxidoreductase [Verrucomicrobiales bacterium]|nr:oxidoreductase [Verrucomicrobiales bacterium]